MSVEHLSQSLAAAGLRPAVVERMRVELLALLGDAPHEPAQACVDRLLGPRGFTRPRLAPFEALWSSAELFLRAALYVVLADGGYTEEKARRVGLLAQRLGWSAHGLSQLEAEVCGAGDGG